MQSVFEFLLCLLNTPLNAQAIESSGTAVGVRCKDGVILGVEKLVASKMLVPGSGRRVQTIDEHVGAVRQLKLPLLQLTHCWCNG